MVRNDLFLFIAMIRSFFSLPAMTTSTASNKSACETAFLPAFYTALIAASLIIFGKIRSNSSAVASAISSKSTVSSILTSLECTFKVSHVPLNLGFYDNTTVKTSWTKKGFIQNFRTVCCCKNNDTFGCVKSIHLCK